MHLIVKFSLLFVLINVVSFTINNDEIKIKWVYEFEEAKRIASVTDKPILISFAGSDWCKPCMLLTREVFETSQFASYAGEHFVMVLADFPRYRKNKLPADQVKKNEKLASEFNKDGLFPLVVVVDAEGNSLGKLGYVEGGPEVYIRQINDLIRKKQ